MTEQPRRPREYVGPVGDLTDDQLGALGGALYDRLTGNEDSMSARKEPNAGAQWTIINDMLSTVRLALMGKGIPAATQNSVMVEIEDYVANQYGDD